jgi:parvulin-like peptidyl-prolyl isomerase
VRFRTAPGLLALLGSLALLAGCGAARPTARGEGVGGPTPRAGASASPTQAEGPPVTATLAPSPVASATPEVPLAARVNGQALLLQEFLLQVDEYQTALLDDGLDPDTWAGQARLAQIRREVLESMIDGALVQQAAAALEVRVSAQSVKNRVQADVEAGGGQAAFDTWLASTGQTVDGYAERVRQALLSEGVMQAVTAEMPLEVEQVHLRQIVVDSQETAEALKAELQQGVDFAALAKEQSLDSATKAAGGDLGWIPRGLISPELEGPAFELAPGRVSGIVPADGAFYLLQVVAREEMRPLSPEVLARLKVAAFRSWLEVRRSAAVIERLVGE